MNKEKSFVTFIFSAIFMGLGWIMVGNTLNLGSDWILYEKVGKWILGYIVVGFIGFLISYLYDIIRNFLDEK